MFPTPRVWPAPQPPPSRNTARSISFVANAGIAGPNHAMWEYPIDIWKQVIDINLVGVFLCCHAIVPHMLRQGYGRIVNVASIAGKEGNPNASAYSASKAGVIALTKSLGKETANRNIAVNCITPAAARTRLFDQMTKEHVDFMLSRIPRGRFLEVDEVSAMVAWLVSEENSFTTGAVFDLSRGRVTYCLLSGSIIKRKKNRGSFYDLGIAARRSRARLTLKDRSVISPASLQTLPVPRC